MTRNSVLGDSPLVPRVLDFQRQQTDNCISRADLLTDFVGYLGGKQGWCKRWGQSKKDCWHSRAERSRKMEGQWAAQPLSKSTAEREMLALISSNETSSRKPASARHPFAAKWASAHARKSWRFVFSPSNFFLFYCSNLNPHLEGQRPFPGGAFLAAGWKASSAG